MTNSQFLTYSNAGKAKKSMLCGKSDGFL